MNTFYVDGKRTKAENAADLCGMQVLSSMTDNRECLRRLFESYADRWSELLFESEAVSRITNDVHSPAEIRVNAVLSSTDRFYEAYDISEGDGMYVPSRERVRVL